MNRTFAGKGPFTAAAAGGRLGRMSMSNNFLIIGNRVINLQHVAAAERDGTRGPVTIYLISAQSNSAAPLRWTFERDEADIVWNKLTAGRADMTDLGGGPYSITDNEPTASRQPRE